MTPTQQAALEALAGRALTTQEVALAAARNDSGLSASISAGRTKLAPHLLTERGVLAALPVPDGDQFLSALETFAAAPPAAAHPLAAYYGTIKRGVSWLKSDGLDVGDRLARQLLDAMAAAGVVDSGCVATIKALAVVPDPIAVSTVSAILNGA